MGSGATLLFSLHKECEKPVRSATSRKPDLLRGGSYSICAQLQGPIGKRETVTGPLLRFSGTRMT